MNDAEHSVEQPAVQRLMAELLNTREQLAPELPLYAKRQPPPLTFDADDPADLYDAMRVIINEMHGSYVQERADVVASRRLRVGHRTSVA